LAEDLVPIDLTGLELGDRSVTTIRTPQCCTNPETAFGKIQPVANAPADAVKFHPPHQRLVHAALKDQILKQPAHRIIGKGSHDGCFQAKAPLQTACNVVFAAALGNFKVTRGPDAAITRIET